MKRGKWQIYIKKEDSMVLNWERGKEGYECIREKSKILWLGLWVDNGVSHQGRE